MHRSSAHLRRSIVAAFLLCSASARAVEPVVPLTLEAAVREALDRSPEIQRSRAELEVIRLQEPLLLSEMDPGFEAGYSRARDEAPRAAPAFEGTRSESTRFNVGLSQKTLLGTQARVDWTNEKVRSDSPFRALDPTVDSRLVLSLEQPLLRYFWGRPDVARRRRFRANVAAAENRLSHLEAERGTLAARAFLEAQFAADRVAIAERSLSSARTLREKQAEKRRYGLVEDSDLLQARAQVEIEETELELARAESEKARHALLEVLQRPAADAGPGLAISTGPRVALAAPSLDEAVAAGLERRGDIRGFAASAESAEWALRTEQLDSLPDLSVIASYGMAGLDRHYSAAWDDLGGWDHRVTSAGLNLRVPLLQRKERLLKKTRRFELTAARADLEGARQEALRQIRDAWTSLEFHRSRLDARRRLLTLQARKLDAEERNFARGRSTTDIIVRFQQDVYRAELDLARALADEAIARVELARATGSFADVLPSGGPR